MTRWWRIIVDPGDRVLQLGLAFLAVLYILLFTQAYPELLTFAAHDDALYVSQAESIASGHWLGEYDRLTLVKTPGYSLFLALGIATGTPYLWILSVFHVAAVVFLLRRSRYLFPGMGLAVLVVGAFLLFNPIFAGALRIYRFQLPAIVFMVFLGSLVGLYDPERRRSHWSVELTDLLTAAVSWGLLWFSREESVIYTAFLVVGLVGYLIVAPTLTSPWWNLRFTIAGMIGLCGFWLFICGMNAHYYGRFVVCEKTAPPYPGLMRTFFEIEDPDLDPTFMGSTASREKIQRIAMEVPEFRAMAENLVKFASRWRGTYLDAETLTVRQKPEEALTISHFEWAWLDASSASGFYESAQTLKTKYQDLDEAIELAVADGRLVADQAILVQFGAYSLTPDDLTGIIRLLPKVYFDLFVTPSAVLRNYRNLCARTTPDSARNKTVELERWASMLGLRYLVESDEAAVKKSTESAANRSWNIATTTFAYVATPLLHLSTPLAVVALVMALLRRYWSYAAAIAVLTATYFAYYLMLTALIVANGYLATNSAYFLPAYSPILLTSFASVSVIRICLRKPIAADSSHRPS